MNEELKNRITVINWQDTLVYGNQYNNYHDNDIEEHIIHTQYIGQCDEYVLVQSHICGDGRDYYNFQIWTYNNVETSSKLYDELYLNKLVKEWES